MTNQIKEELDKAIGKISRDRAAEEALSYNLAKEENNLNSNIQHIDALLEVRGLFQTAAQATQQRLEFHIGGLVSTALAAVFDDPDTFLLEFVQKRNKTEAELWFVNNGEKINPVDASGGGACDIASLALRVAFWSLTKKTRPLIFLDEPLKHLSDDLQEKAADMLKMLSEKLGLQIVMVSHIKKLIAGADREFKIGS